MKRSTTKRAALASILAMICSGSALALPVVFVDATIGTPTGDGTSGDPVQTLQQGLAIVDAGGTINLAAGTYIVNQLNITQPVAILGPNVGTNPNNSNWTAASRSPEAVIMAGAHNGGITDYSTSYMLFFSAAAAGSTIDGVTIDGFNPDPLTPGQTQTGISGDQVGNALGVLSNANSFTFRNNIVRNISQFGVQSYASNPTVVNSTVVNNRFMNIGIPNVLGFGMAFLGSTNAYALLENNYAEDMRQFCQFQGHRAVVGTNSVNAGDAIIRGNYATNLETQGIFMNLFSLAAKDFLITNNTLIGQSPNTGTAGIALVSQYDGTAPTGTPRRHTISGNNISNFFNGLYFTNNQTDKQRVSGGTISNVSYAAMFSNRLGYNGLIDYTSTGSLAGRDGTGGPATFDSAIARAALEAGLTAEIALPPPVTKTPTRPSPLASSLARSPSSPSIPPSTARCRPNAPPTPALWPSSSPRTTSPRLPVPRRRWV